MKYAYNTETKKFVTIREDMHTGAYDYVYTERGWIILIAENDQKNDYLLRIQKTVWEFVQHRPLALINVDFSHVLKFLNYLEYRRPE